MTEDYEDIDNPYQTPNEPSEGQTHGPSTPAPRGLKSVAIIAIILGSLGLIGVLGGVTELVFKDQLDALTGRPAGSGQDFERVNEELASATAKYATAKLIAAIIHVPLALALLIGGIRSLKGQPSGRSLLMVAAGCAVVFELGVAILAGMVQWELLQVLNSQDAQPELLAFFKIATLLVAACDKVWLLAKLIYYVIALVYLRRPHVKHHFDPDSFNLTSPPEAGFSQ